MSEFEFDPSRYEGMTPGKWHACGDGKCPCKHIMNDHGMICEVTAGEWGDPYPAIRVREDGTAEAFIERIPYGSVAESAAIANARLIADAPDLLRLLIEHTQAKRRKTWLERFLGK